MITGRKILVLLTWLFVGSEILFGYSVASETNANGDIVYSSVFKSLIFLLLVLLTSKKLKPAKWILCTFLLLQGLLCIFAEHAVFMLIGLFDIGFAGIVYWHFLTSGKPSTITAPSPGQDSDGGECKVVPLNVYRYPQLVNRYKALLIDAILIFAVLISIMMMVEGSTFRTPVMVLSATFLLLTYEPLLTTYSKTVGQRIMKIRVGRMHEPNKRITLLNAYVRWFVKGFLGWLSFITISFNSERRAIHDFASDSVMVQEQ